MSRPSHDRKKLAIAVFLLATSAPGIRADVVIDTVFVGNRGNTADTRYATPGYGGVDYFYNIGKYEVTAGQYTEFLNSVAGVDTYGLYGTGMWTHAFGCKIQRAGGGTLGDPYTYSVALAAANRPVNCVSFWDACRFANWLHNGQPTGVQGPGTTETGAYSLTAESMSNNTVGRNSDWRWAVAGEDEWYKAAYHKNLGTSADYWDYPTSSLAAPGRDMADASGNNANIYAEGGPYPIDPPYYTTIVGEFQNSESPYGTFDQGGNLWEWNEAIIGSLRCMRGGAFGPNGNRLHASDRDDSAPTYEGGHIGFRVVAIPEPAAAFLLTLAGLLVAVRRR